MMDSVMARQLGDIDADVDQGKINAMRDNYDERKVAHFESDDWLTEIDTALVMDNDPSAPYETAILDKRYAYEWIAVANAATREEAMANHEQWVRTMTEALPESLIDVGTSETSRSRDARGTAWRTCRRKDNRT